MSHEQIMLTIRIADQSDQTSWDDYVVAHPEATPYHLFAWREAIEESYNHSCYYLIAEQSGRIAGLLPLVHLHLPFVVNELTALPFCDVGNCLCADPAVQDSLIEYALKVGEKLKTRKICLRGELPNTDFFRTRFAPVQTGKIRMLFDLPSSGDELFAGFKSKLRSQIRKAEKNGVVFRWGSLMDLDGIFRVFSKNMHSLGSPVHSKRWLQSILTAFKESAKVGLAIYEDQVVGMGIILFCGQTVAIPWASTLNEFNRLNPNMLLYWNFLRYSADNGYSRFDFGRSSEGEGTYKFKEQWGAKPKPLMWYVQSGTIYDVEKQAASSERERIADIWRKTPFAIANMLGPRIRKYISL